MSVLVPPMSNGIRLPSPTSRAAWTLPATPPAGPDSTAPAASRPASAIGATPPCDWMIRVGPHIPGFGEPLFEAGEIARHGRPDIGVDDGRRDPLEFLDLRQHLGRQRDIDAGQLVFDRRARRLLVARVAPGVQIAHRHRLDPLAPSRPRSPRSSEPRSSGVSTRPSPRSRSRTPSRSRRGTSCSGGGRRRL